jgi:hypothetical protein
VKSQAFDVNFYFDPFTNDERREEREEVLTYSYFSMRLDSP